MLTIITDSSSNITAEQAKRLGIIVMPLTISLGGKEFRDGIDIDSDGFYKMLMSTKEFPHTSQLYEEQVEAAVRKALTMTNEVLIMPIASALSGSFERCERVAKRYEGVYAYDTKCTSAMLAMLVLKAAQNVRKPMGEVIKILDAFRPKIKLFAALDTIEYLAKGGRLSKLSALLGTALKIKPVITIDGGGKVALVSKQFGMAKSINYIAERAAKADIDYGEPVYLLYTADDRNCSELIRKTGIKFSEKCNICPVIGTHIGPFAAGLVYAER